jgi:hypothetical protein
VDFVPLASHIYAIHLMTFWGGCFKFIPRSLHALVNFADVKADPALVQMKQKEFVWSSSSVCVSQDLRAVMMDAVLSIGSPIQPVNFPGVVTMKR